ASSVVDLHAFFPASENLIRSAAYDIDAAGNIFGVGYQSQQSGGIGEYIVEWSPILAGDFNRDGQVDAGDIKAMQNAMANIAAFETNLGFSDAQLLALDDVNGDGAFDNADFQALLTKLRSGGSSSTSTPEPAAILLLALGGLGLAGKKITPKRRHNS